MAFGRVGALGTGFARLGGGAGAFAWPPHNLITASKVASNVADSANVTHTADVTAGPLGDVTADQVVFGAGNSAYMYKTTSAFGLANTTYCGSVWLKAAAPVQIGMRCLHANGSGTVGTKVVSVTTAFQRFNAVCVTGPATGVNVYVGLDVRTFVTSDDGLAKTIICADWQINRGSVPTAFVAT